MDHSKANGKNICAPEQKIINEPPLEYRVLFGSKQEEIKTGISIHE